MNPKYILPIQNKGDVATDVVILVEYEWCVNGIRNTDVVDDFGFKHNAVVDLTSRWARIALFMVLKSVFFKRKQGRLLLEQ
jgi:hypothetical protein